MCYFPFMDDDIFPPRKLGDPKPIILTDEEFDLRFERFLDACCDAYNDSSYVPRSCHS